MLNRDIVLVPSPGYPVYKISTLLAGGTYINAAQRGETTFFQTLIGFHDVLKRAKIIFINYPNNLTVPRETMISLKRSST